MVYKKVSKIWTIYSTFDVLTNILISLEAYTHFVLFFEQPMIMCLLFCKELHGKVYINPFGYWCFVVGLVYYKDDSVNVF